MTGVLIAVEIRDEVSNHFPTVIVTFRLRRKPRYYTVNLIVPCCFFSLIVVSTFLLQPSSQDRLQVGTYAFLTSIIRPHFMVGAYVNEVARYQARVHVFRHPSTDSQHQTIGSTVNTVDAYLQLRHVKTGLLQRRSRRPASCGLDRLQSVINAATRLTVGAQHHDHITPLLVDLH